MLLEVRNLGKRYPQGTNFVDVLKGVTFHIERGEFVALKGPSGSGKSTLLQLVGGLDHPSTGEVRLEGEVVGMGNDRKVSKFRRRSVGFIFQAYHLIPRLSVKQNVALPLQLDGTPTSKRNRRSHELLECVGLGHRANSFPLELSGGEMQRVAIARALVADPPLVLADEPTGNLDSTNASHVMELLYSLAKRLHRTVLVVTHDNKVAMYADRQLELVDGRLV